MDWDNYGKWRKEQKVKGNNQITILEKEQIQQYFTTNNIQSIKLSNNKLLIKYNHKEEEEEEEEPNTSELQQIKDYIQKQPSNILTLKDLEKKKDSSSVDNKDKGDKTGLYIGLGVIGVLVILIAFIFIRRNKNKKY